MKLKMNDGHELTIQTAVESGEVLSVKLLNQTADSIKAVFGDSLAVQKMIAVDDYGTETEYEGYTDLVCISEYTGAIWEVKMRKPEADPGTRLSALEEKMPQKAEQSALEQAIAELTMTIAMGQGVSE